MLFDRIITCLKGVRYMKKRLLSIALAALLVFSAAFPAFADGEEEQERDSYGELSAGVITLSDADSTKDFYYFYADDVKVTKETTAMIQKELSDADIPLPVDLSAFSFDVLDQFVVAQADQPAVEVSDVDPEDPSAMFSDFNYMVFDNAGSLEASVARAFPKFTFTPPEPQKLDEFFGDGSDFVLADDDMSATYTIYSGPAYVSVPVNGQVASVYMVNGARYIYSFTSSKFDGSTTEKISNPFATASDSDMSGTDTSATDASPSDASPSDTSASDATVSPTEVSPTETTTTTEETTTTTEETTTTTEETTTTTEETTTTTEETTTTTESTTTTTAPEDDTYFIDFSKPKLGYVNTKSLPLRLRTGPGFDYSILTVMPRHTLLTVDGQLGDWYHVRTEDGRQGYCYVGYVSFDLDNMKKR